MIPYNLSWTMPTSDITMLKRHVKQGLPAAITITNPSTTGITRHDTTLWKIILSSTIANTHWAVNMHCVVRNSSHVELGRFKIVNIDFTNNYLYVEDTQNLLQVLKATASEVIQGGLCPAVQYINDATPLKNNLNQVVAFQHAIANTTNYHFFETSIKDNEIFIQVVNNHASVALGAVTVKWSLNQVNWLDFATPLSESSVSAGASVGFSINNQCKKLYILISVTATTASTYYILAS